MSYAIFGGSFDPVHLGHLFIADEVIHAFGYERVIFVPAYQAPHKNDRPSAAEEDRLAMLQAAVADRPEFEIDEYELEQREVSYTINTIRYLRERYPDEPRPGLIIGDDLTHGFATWREADKLPQLVDILVAYRQGEIDTSQIGRYRRIDNAPLPVSSSEIRARIRGGRNFRYLVPDTVHAMITAQSLYREVR